MKSQKVSVLALALVIGFIVFIALALLGWIDKFLYGWGVDIY